MKVRSQKINVRSKWMKDCSSSKLQVFRDRSQIVWMEASSRRKLCSKLWFEICCQAWEILQFVLKFVIKWVPLKFVLKVVVKCGKFWSLFWILLINVGSLGVCYQVCCQVLVQSNEFGAELCERVHVREYSGDHLRSFSLRVAYPFSLSTISLLNVEGRMLETAEAREKVYPTLSEDQQVVKHSERFIWRRNSSTVQRWDIVGSGSAIKGRQFLIVCSLKYVSLI